MQLTNIHLTKHAPHKHAPHKTCTPQTCTAAHKPGTFTACTSQICIQKTGNSRNVQDFYYSFAWFLNVCWCTYLYNPHLCMACDISIKVELLCPYSWTKTIYFHKHICRNQPSSSSKASFFFHTIRSLFFLASIMYGCYTPETFYVQWHFHFREFSSTQCIFVLSAQLLHPSKPACDVLTGITLSHF